MKKLLAAAGLVVLVALVARLLSQPTSSTPSPDPLVTSQHEAHVENHEHKRADPIEALPFKYVEPEPLLEDDPWTGVVGKVTKDGQPIDGADVWAIQIRRTVDQATVDSVADRKWRDRARQDGSFEIKLPPGTYMLRAFLQKPGSTVQMTGDADDAAFPLTKGEKKLVTLVVGGGISCHGSAKDVDGNGIEGVEVMATPCPIDTNIIRPSTTAMTGKDGSFLIEGLSTFTNEVDMILIAGEKTKGMDVTPRSARKFWQQSFDFILVRPKPQELFTKVRIDYRFPAQTIGINILRDGVPIGDTRQGQMITGENIWAADLPKAGAYSVELFGDNSTMLIPLTMDPTETNVLTGSSTHWKESLTVRGRIVGDKGRYWVHIIGDENPASPHLCTTFVKEDGTFELSNVPVRDGLRVAVQFESEPMLIGDKFTIPVKSNLGDLVVNKQP